MAGQAKATGAKRQKERQRAEKRQLKAEKAERRRAEAAVKEPTAEGVDPDIAGIVAGPQPILEQDA